MKLHKMMLVIAPVLLGTAFLTMQVARSQEAPKPPEEAPAATCHDNVKNQDESDVDCGGAKCPKCGVGKACTAETDCKPGACINNACDHPPRTTCIDQQKNGTETDVDCGGDKCPKCEDGKGCASNADCKTGACESNTCAAPKKAPTCFDNEKNGDEADVDCGGPKCPGCNAGKQCKVKSDCRSKVCSDAGTCGEG